MFNRSAHSRQTNRFCDYIQIFLCFNNHFFLIRKATVILEETLVGLLEGQPGKLFTSNSRKGGASLSARLISMHKQIYDYTKIIQGIRNRMGDFSIIPFYELRRKLPEETVKSASPKTTGDFYLELNKFRKSVSQYFEDKNPFSFLFCVIKLFQNPADMYDTGKHDLLLKILSDRGVLFDEVRPTSPDQYNTHELCSVIRTESEHRQQLISSELPAHEIHQTETTLISEAWEQFHTEFDEVYPFQQKDIDSFLRYIRDFFTRRDEPDMDIIIGSCPYLREQKFEIMLQRLKEVCLEVKNNHVETLYRASCYKTLSCEAVSLNRKYQKIHNQLKQHLDALSQTPEDISASFLGWLKSPNGEDVGLDWKDPNIVDDGWIPERQRKGFPLAKLHQYLTLPNNTDGLKSRIFHIACIYIQKRENKTPLSNSSAIESIVEFSLSELFRLCTLYDEDDKTEITYAPVVTFLIISASINKILNDSLKTISPELLVPRKENCIITDQVLDDFHFFDNLCEAYSAYYGQSFTQEHREIWNYLFLRYSGYNSILKEADNYRTLIKHCASVLPFYIRCVYDCVNANRIVPLLHSAIVPDKTLLDHFRPEKPEDPGWEVLQYFRQHLINRKDNRKRCVDCVSKYCDFIANNYSDNAMQSFLDSCLLDLISSDEDFCEADDKKTDYRALFNQLNYCGVFEDPENASHWKGMVLRGSLEYAIRWILADQCYTLLFHCVDLTIKRSDYKKN